MTYSVSTNFDCDHETALEGEDREILAIVKEGMAGLMKSVETMRKVVSSEIAKRCLMDLEIGLGELWHDSSIAYCVDKATESAVEARVITVSPKVANAGISERLDTVELRKPNLEAAE